MFFSHVNIPLFLSPSFSKISKKKISLCKDKKIFLEGRNVSRSQHCINFTAQTSIEEGSRGPLWDSPLGAHSSLWGCRSMGCSRDTEASTFSLWVGCDLPIDTKSNNNRLRPQGWPGLGVSLGWLPSCKMVPPPQAQHSYQSGVPSNSCFLSGCQAVPAREGTALSRHSSTVKTGSQSFKSALTSLMHA